MFCFSFRNFHLRLWFGSWEGAPVPRAVSDSVQDPGVLGLCVLVAPWRGLCPELDCPHGCFLGSLMSLCQGLREAEASGLRVCSAI